MAQQVNLVRTCRLTYSLQVLHVLEQVKVRGFWGDVAGAARSPLVVGHHGEIGTGKLLKVEHIVAGKPRLAVDGDKYVIDGTYSSPKSSLEMAAQTGIDSMSR